MNHPAFAPSPQAARGKPVLRYLGGTILAFSLAVGLLPLYAPWLAIGLYEGTGTPPAFVEMLIWLPMFAILLVPLGLIGSTIGVLLLWFGRKRAVPK